MGNPVIKDLQTLMMAGINPKTGYPSRIEEQYLKEGIKKQLRVVDEQDAINRFCWYNLPDSIDGNLIERILYYRGQGILFYLEEVEKFFFLPFALSDTIDVYGRYTGVTPLPFNGKSEVTKKDEKQKAWIVGLDKKPVYDVLLPNEVDIDKMLNSCVILKDYSQQYSQTIIPRKDLNEPIIDVMADMIPFMRTSLMNQTGVAGMRVNSQDEQSNVEAANRTINDAALKGSKYVAVVGGINFQELTTGQVGDAASFMQSLESLDNYRLGLYGIDNGGLFQKKTHMLETEQAMAGGATGLVLEDSLKLRQQFCDIVNSIWDLGIWCEASECIQGDTNMDGFIGDEYDQSGDAQGDQPQGV